MSNAPRTSARAATVLGLATVLCALGVGRWVTAVGLDLGPATPGPGGQATLVVAGVLLLRLAAGLRRARRVDWCVAVFTCGLLATVDLARDVRRPADASVALALLAFLLIGRGRFTAARHATGRWHAVRAGVLGSGLSLLLGLATLTLPGRVPRGTSIGARVAETGATFVGLPGPAALQGDRFTDVFTTSMAGLGVLTGSLVLLLLLRPARPAPCPRAADESRLRGLLGAHGSRDSLGYFALRHDKDVVWSPTGKSAVAYRVIKGVALASGDPIGDPEAWPGAIHAYADLAARNGWTPAVIGTSELGATVYRREAGLSALGLGDEAILHASTFTLDGRSMRGVRQACNRSDRAGYTVSVRRVVDLTAVEVDELQSAAAAWRADPTERGFSMALSRLGATADADCVVVTARQDGILRGLLHFVPWGPDGLSLDLMRRDRDSDNGVNELMIAAVMRDCPTLYVERVSLNFAVFRDALERGQRIGAGPVLRLWCRTLLLASRYWQIDSLYRFNDKFSPSWQPRYLSYAAARDLPRIAVAALEAEGFLTWPAPLRRVGGRP